MGTPISTPLKMAQQTEMKQINLIDRNFERYSVQVKKALL